MLVGYKLIYQALSHLHLSLSYRSLHLNFNEIFMFKSDLSQGVNEFFKQIAEEAK